VRRPLAIALLLFAAILAACFVRYAAPSPRGEDAPAHEASAARARKIQEAIAGGEPRSIGSEANARARAFLEGELARYGYKTEIQRATSCGRHGACALVANVIATRDGREPALAPVLLMAHYDSVPCGPGASDDGMGTSAVMEAARAIAAGPALRRTVVVVLTDAEESGLLGAEAFARAHPLGKRVAGAVNVDARGSRGPSALFETSAGNALVLDLAARALARPITSSLFYEIYRRMPNDTDFTAVKATARGVNFANIGGVEHYHTPLDSLANASLATLQHHAEQALAMTRALADAGPELDAPPHASSDAVWFDVLALFIVRWPARWTVPIALAALALVALQVLRLRARDRTVGLGLLAAPVALLAAAATSIVAGAALASMGAAPVPWVAHPLPALVFLHLGTATAGVTAGAFVAGRSEPGAVWAGTWLLWGAIGVAVAAVAPGASFLFVVPTAVAGLAAFAPANAPANAAQDARAGIGVTVKLVAPACAAALLFLPVAILAHDALGFAVPALACASTTLLVTTLPALAPRRLSVRPLAAMASLALVAAIAAAALPSFSTAHPQRVNVVFRQDASGAAASPASARVVVEAAWAHVAWGAAPQSMVAALGLPPDHRPAAAGIPSLPWSRPGVDVDVPPIDLPPPEATVMAPAPDPGPRRRARVLLRSARGAATLVLQLEASRHPAITIAGQRATLRDAALALRGVPAEGIEVEVEADGDGPVDGTLFDLSRGVPAQGEGAAKARAAVEARRALGTATESQEGDVTIAARRVHL